MKKELLYIWLGCLSSQLWSQSLLVVPPQKGFGYVGLKTSYTFSQRYFDHTGSLKTTLPNGQKETYHQANVNLETQYGVSDELSLWFTLPFLLRHETKSLQVTTWGLGDIESGARFRLLHRPAFQLFTGISTLLPSGNTNVNYDSSKGIREFPLGKGVTEIAPSLMFSQTFKSFSFNQELSYSFSLSNTVAYLATASVLAQQNSQGGIILSPAGNLNIDWGDKIKLRSHNAWQVNTAFGLFIDLDYVLRQKTHVTDYVYSQNGSALNSDIQNITFSAAQRLNASIGSTFMMTDHLQWLLTASHPLYGKNSPIWELSFVESLVGPTVSTEIRYVF